MRHCTEKPTTKQLSPMRIITGNSFGQVTDMVFTIPAGKIIKKLLDRVINGNMIGIQISNYILIPKFDALIHSIHRNTCHHPLIYRTKIKVETVPFTILHARSQLVEPKLIAAFHKLIRLHDEQLLRQQTTFIGKSPARIIHVFHCLTNQKFIFRQTVMTTRPSHGIFLWNAGTKTLLSQANKQ